MQCADRGTSAAHLAHPSFCLLVYLFCIFHLGNSYLPEECNMSSNDVLTYDVTIKMKLHCQSQHIERSSVSHLEGDCEVIT